MAGKLNVAVVGCGSIADRYVEQIETYDTIEIRGYADQYRERAERFAARHGGIAYGSLDHVLADPQVDIIVNLTIHTAHAEVVAACLEAGKHVYSEKPLAMTYLTRMRYDYVIRSDSMKGERETAFRNRSCPNLQPCAGLP